MYVNQLIKETLENLQSLFIQDLSVYLTDVPYILRDIKKILQGLDIEDYHYNNGTYISPLSLHEHYVELYKDYRKLRRTIATEDFEDVKDDLNYFNMIFGAITDEDWNHFVKPYEPKSNV